MIYNNNENNDCEVYNPTNSCCDMCNNYCLKMVFAIFAALFLFAVGLIIGAIIFYVILKSISAFVILAAILFILAAVTGILILCRRRRG